MNHQITCVCGNRFYVSESQLSQHVTCPACNRVLVPVPTQTAAVSAPPAAAPAPTDPQALKRCPFCGETILAVARKCRFCNEFLDRAPTALAPGGSAVASSAPPAASDIDPPPAIFAVSVSQWDNFFRYLICAAIVVVSGFLLLYLLRNFSYVNWIFTAIFAATAIGAYFIYISTQHTRCIIRANRIETESGIFTKKIDQLELFRVVDLELKQSFMERLLGIGTIVIKSNDALSPTLELYQIPQARNIYQYLQNQIPKADKERGSLRVER